MSQFLPGRGAGTTSLAAAYEKAGFHAPGFDTLRVVAASAVIFHHSMGYELDFRSDDWLYLLSGGYTHLGFMAVCAFFCISGFLVAPGLARSGDVVGYLSRRMVRIMPLLVVVVVATVFLIGPIATRLPLSEYFSRPETYLYLKNISTSLSLVLPGVSNQTGTQTVNGALWTLRYEILCYIALAVFSLAGFLRRPLLLIPCWLAATAVAFVGVRYPEWHLGQATTFCHLFAYFGGGTLMYLFGKKVPVSPLLGGLAAVLLGLVLMTDFEVILAPLLTAYLIVVLGLVRWPWSNLLSRGDPSYGIYLMHGPIMVLALSFWRPDSYLTLFATVFVLTVPAALLSWFLLEKPALAHKMWPAQVFRRSLARFRPLKPVG